MSWHDAITMAGRELRRRTGRAALTVLAVALAAALLSALLAVAGTAKTRVLAQLSHGGSLAGISVEPNFPAPGQETLDDPVPGPPHPLTAAAVEAIRRLGDVSSIYAVTAEPTAVQPPAPSGVSSFPTSVFSADLAHAGALPITLLAGRLPTPASPLEVDVGSGYLEQLHLPLSRASQVVGTWITLSNEATLEGVVVLRQCHLEIVGVVDQQLGSGDLLAWPAVTTGIATFEEEMQADPDTVSPYVGAVVVARQLSQVSAVRAQIAGLGYSTSAPVGLIISVGRYLHVVELVLSGIGLVALGIAALGIANALLAAVRERRREIGVLKAIGARDGDVLRVFVVEAAVLGLVGGLLGTAGGLAMAAAISADANAYLHSQGLAGVALSVPWPLPVGAVAGSVLVALLAGIPPALRAAHLPAREAVDA